MAEPVVPPEEPVVPPEERARSTPGLVNDVIAQFSALLRNETDLARAEVQESVTKAATALGLIVGGIILILTALNVLVAAIVAWLAELEWLDGGWAALIVGVVLAVIAAIMLMKGQRDLSATSLAPTRTTTNVRRDAQAVKEGADGR